MTRTLVVWCPDWPMTARGIPPDRPAAIVAANRVTVTTAAARAAGVRAGLRRREAQARCPDLEVLDPDADGDARSFAPVVGAVVGAVPATEVVRPGLLALAVRGPARVLGGERGVADHLLAVVTRTLASAADGPVGCRIGVADSRFGAIMAARHASSDAPVRHLATGGNAAFLAGLPVTALTHDPALVTGAVDGLLELLRRLGISRLGDLATLPELAVGGRFGRLGLRAHRLARGDDDTRLVAVDHVPERMLQVALDPSATQVEPVAFAVRGPVETLLDELAARQLTCTLVTVEAVSEHDERCVRRWRSHEGFTAARLVDRVRWQLDGWLTGAAGDPRPTAAVTSVRFVPEELVDGGQQTSLLDAATAPTPAVVRALTRVQGMLGPDAVLVAVPAGGRDPARWVRTVPWDPAGVGTDPSATARPPWPGRLPTPSPATVLTDPSPAEVVDASGTAVTVSGRGVVSGDPHRVRVASGPWHTVVGWAGPWPADERWWEPDGRRRARFQLAVEGGPALLLALEGGRWTTEAVYD